MKQLFRLSSLFLTAFLMQLGCTPTEKAIYKSDAFSVYSNRVEQGNFKVTALSSTEMTSDYRSPEADKYSPNVEFKFSINLRDDEMAPGKNHTVTLQPVNGA